MYIIYDKWTGEYDLWPNKPQYNLDRYIVVGVEDDDRAFCEGCPNYIECEGPCAAYEDAQLENEADWPEEEI